MLDDYPGVKDLTLPSPRSASYHSHELYDDRPLELFN